MGDEQDRAAGRRGQEVAEQRAAGPGIDMGRGLVEYEQLRIAEQGPGQGQPLLSDLLTATAGRTVLLITHDLAELDGFDEVVALDGGIQIS